MRFKDKVYCIEFHGWNVLEKLSRLVVVLSSSFFSCIVHAYWAPRVTGLGEIGEYGSLWADGLFPIQDTSSQVKFIDFQVEANRFYSDGNYAGIYSPGVGLRKAFSNEKVVGLYLFSDYMRTNVNQNYWLLSPGMDFYHGPLYGAFNAYVPVNNASRQTGTEVAASDAGITQYESLSGHSQYDRLIQNYYTMRWGMDLTGGRLFGDRNEWGIKLGGYLYESQYVNSITGARGEVDYYINDSVVLTFEQRYDNVFYSQTIVGIKVSFLGKDNRGTVETQLKAPIYRNLNINTTNAGTPIGEYQQTSSQTYLIQNNITFVSNAARPSSGSLLDAGAITGDGTYENPYTGLDQTILNNANTIKNSTIWVEGTGGNHPYADATTLSLQAGQSIYGRTKDFKLGASSASVQPTFYFAPESGLAALYIDNSNTLQDFIMQRYNGADDAMGVHVANASRGTAVINGLTIGTSATDSGFATALYNQGGNLSINDSTLYAAQNLYTVSGTSLGVQGVFGIHNDGGIIAISQSRVFSNLNQLMYSASSMGQGIMAGSWGIYNAADGIITIDQSEVTAQANTVKYDADASIAGGDLAGVFGVANHTGQLTIINSTVNAKALNVIDTRIPNGGALTSIIGAFGLYNTNGTMAVSNSSLIKAIALNVDNIGYDVLTTQGLLDYVGAFGAYNDGGSIGNTATLDVKNTRVVSSAETVSASSFGLQDPAVSAAGLWNNGNFGTANATIEQGATVDVNANWKIAATGSAGSAVNVFGLYNQGYQGAGLLIADAATVNVTETGADGSSAGQIAGAVNGSLNGGSGSTAVTIIKGETKITAQGTGPGLSVYGFENIGNYDDTEGTRIEGGSTIDSEGGTSGGSIAVYNTTVGKMAIQGTADQHVVLIANGAIDGGSNLGVHSYNLSTMTIDYATIIVGPTATGGGGDSKGIYNADNSMIHISDSTIKVTTADGGWGYGVYNDGTSMTYISASIFNVKTSGTGTAYGFSDLGGGITFSTSSVLELNYTPADGSGAAFTAAGTYNNTSNLTCDENGTIGCTTG